MKKVLTSLLALPILAGGLIGCSSASPVSNDRIVRGPHPFSDFGNGPTAELTVNCTNPGLYDENETQKWVYLSDVVEDESNKNNTVGLAVLGGMIQQVCENPDSRPVPTP